MLDDKNDTIEDLKLNIDKYKQSEQILNEDLNTLGQKL